MKCISCTIDVPPQFANAINMNVCPSCGGEILDVASKELFTGLKEAIAKMAEDPGGLAHGLSGWILSNYTLQKIGTAEPTKFHRKVSESEMIERRPAEKKMKIAKNSVQDFLRRKDANIANTVAMQPDLESIVNEINGGGIDEEEGEELNEGEEYGLSEEEMEDEVYQEAISNRKNFQSKAKLLANQGNMLLPGGDGKKLSRAELAEMQKIVSGMGSKGSDDLPDVLQMQRVERLRKSRAISDGGTDDFVSGRGSFRRGS